jgi:hypothetical protein
MYMDNWRPGGTGWMDLDLVGQQSGALVAFVHLCQLRTVRCMDPGQATDLLSRAYTCLWEREDLFLSCRGFRLFRTGFLGWLYILGWGGLSTILRPGLQCWGLRVRAWTGTWTPWQEWNELVLLVPGVQARRVFSRHPAGYIDSRIAVSAWRYGLTTLWHHSKNWHWKDEEMFSVAQPCLIIDQVLA